MYSLVQQRLISVKKGKIKRTEKGIGDGKHERKRGSKRSKGKGRKKIYNQL